MKLTQRDLANCAVLPEVDPDVEKLLRGLVTLDWKDAELPKVLELFKDLSKGRRETARHTGEYLDTLARPGRVPKIVIAGLEGGPRSTGLDAVEGQSPESNPVALIKLKSIASARSFLEKQTAKRDPFSFRLDYVVLEFVKSEKPPKHTPNRKVKMRSWKRMQLAGDHLMETLADHAIRDVDPDTGKEYYARRMGQKLRKGKRDPENLKDSPIRKELYLLRRALEWFFGTRDITERIPTLTMPAFLELEVQFFTYDEFMRLMWACLGWDFEKGLRVKIDPATSRWLIRFFVLYFLTGTRYDANSKMVWGYNDFVGCIDLENGHIWRNGGKAPKSKTKPRKRSLALRHPRGRKVSAQLHRQGRRRAAPLGRRQDGAQMQVRRHHAAGTRGLPRRGDRRLVRQRGEHRGQELQERRLEEEPPGASDPQAHRGIHVGRPQEGVAADAQPRSGRDAEGRPAREGTSVIEGIVRDVFAPPRPRAERPPFPLPTPGDVVRLTVALDDFRHKEEATIPAAILAAAACARIHNFQACEIRIGTHWSPDNPGYLLVPDIYVARPAYLLPIVQHCFRQVYDTYGKKEGMLLFSADVESEARKVAIRQIFGHLGDRLDIDTGNIFPAMHAFFDNALPPGLDQDLVFALTGPKYQGGARKGVSYDTDVDKLRRILEVHHPLANPVGAFLGTRGRHFIEKQPTNLPPTATGRRRETSEAYDSDETVLEMRALAWPKDEEEWPGFRLERREEYFPRIRTLWMDEKKLTKREVAFLFKATLGMVAGWVSVENYRFPRPEAIERPKEEWMEIFCEAYRNRGTKGPFTVWRETAHAEKCALTYWTIHDWWKKAGLIETPRGRPKKRRPRPNR
jgi:hypothetical protein